MTINKISKSFVKNTKTKKNGMTRAQRAWFDTFAMVVSPSGSTLPLDDKGIILTSGAHIREYALPELLARFIEKLVESCMRDAKITKIYSVPRFIWFFMWTPITGGRQTTEKYLNALIIAADHRTGMKIWSGHQSKLRHFWSNPMGSSSTHCTSINYHDGSTESEPETQDQAQYAHINYSSLDNIIKTISRRICMCLKEIWLVAFFVFVNVHLFGSYSFLSLGSQRCQISRWWGIVDAGEEYE